MLMWYTAYINKKEEKIMYNTVLVLSYKKHKHEGLEHKKDLYCDVENKIRIMQCKT